METTSLKAAWEKAISALDPEDAGPALKSVVSQTVVLGDLDGTILLAVPNEWSKNYLESRSSLINPLLTYAMDKDVRIAITIDATIEERMEVVPTEEIQTSPEFVPSVVSTNPPARNELPFDSRLNPKYVFDTFVIGSSNRFANAAAAQTAEQPGRVYNPLFIYGDSGLGKTHLIHAIGNYALELAPHLRVKYVSSEEFTNDFINSIRAARGDEFQRRYREIDILLIDDIQFIQGKEQTVEEFFHTFNTLYNAGKQVIITSDVPPKMLSGLEDRLRSRFEMGLTVDIKPPELETRIAILRKKTIAENLDVDNAVLEYIASRISSNIRELEGALIRVTAYANLTGQEINRALAELVLKDIISDPGDSEITVALIMGQIADYFDDVSIDKLCSADRSRNLVEARQIAMYLCRELTDLSLPKIGHNFGGRDHTTVMHAYRKIAKEINLKPEIYKHVTELTSRIKQQARNNN
ncbi:chromosomal replication initiator protein DnaA [Gleimia sp. 6138-11-ORH1]|uniref:chromosomal replication initiator protein DnaA n=1 Tax=Gleimia sp. 6138-11-ORH1 TaxID=2973937 RepID=UPI00216A6D82|nr:chromosomal replication initiator protein DnaA [Gleimia sp. 6138-11-ORH1]MCS4485129.1 chromosomal replication initiator protein DnaA [Gleimia sp. 6138-11-ORH1]